MEIAPNGLRNLPIGSLEWATKTLVNERNYDYDQDDQNRDTN